MSGNKQFDTDAAIDSAISLFKDKGFSGTSISDLEKATKLNKSSIYNAFGNKDGLYTASLERFRLFYTSKALAKLDQPDFKTAIYDYCDFLVGGFDDIQIDQGCLASLAALEMGGQESIAKESIKKGLDDMLACLEARCQLAIDQGQLSNQWNANSLAALIIAVNRGAIVMNRGRGNKVSGKSAYQGLFTALFGKVEDVRFV